MMPRKGGGLGISPVATTIILVAAAIVAAVAVAFWESGALGHFYEVLKDRA